MKPETLYAKCGDIHIAYQEFGDGPAELILIPPFVSNVENFWEEPGLARWLQHLSRYARVVMFDKRGTGMSDHVSDLPGLDKRIEDVQAVMNAAEMHQPALLGLSEGGPLAALFAATHPDSCSRLILNGTFSKFSSWVDTDEGFAGFLDYIDNAWGSGESLQMFCPSQINDQMYKKWWAQFERRGASPGAAAALMKMNRQIDISDILGSIRVPTKVIHRTGDATISVEGGRYLAKHIPGATLIEFSGIDHIPSVGDEAIEIADSIGEFLTGAKSHVTSDRVLATVLFTDIVSSTEKAVALGDQQWGNLLEDHHSIVRRNIAEFRGREIDTTGDSFFVTFDGPARAVLCAQAISEDIKSLGISIRAGVHTGECEAMGDNVGGIAVHIGARISALADAGEVLVSSTVRDLVAGSGLQFTDRGLHSLKGIPGEFKILCVNN